MPGAAAGDGRAPAGAVTIPTSGVGGQRVNPISVTAMNWHVRHPTFSTLANRPGSVSFDRGTRSSATLFDEQYRLPERGFAGG